MVRSWPMKRLVAAAVIAGAASSWGQADVIFGSGRAPVFVNEEIDKRYLKSRVHKALVNGTQDPSCAHLLGALLTVLAETAPTLHKRDHNFYLDPHLVRTLQTELTLPRFPGAAYLGAMVRRVMIDRRLPQEYLQMGAQLSDRVMTLDVGKLRYLADGVRPIDSFLFTPDLLRERYDVEVVRANTAAAPGALKAFQDSYQDRDIAWSGLTLVDIKPAPRLKKDEDDGAALVAYLEHRPPRQREESGDWRDLVKGSQKVSALKMTARLAADQYLDVTRLPKGKRLTVRGRLWNIGKGLTGLEIREALLFEDRDWSQGARLIDPAVVARCPLAVNDLSGQAPKQPGGFGQR